MSPVFPLEVEGINRGEKRKGIYSKWLSGNLREKGKGLENVTPTGNNNNTNNNDHDNLKMKTTTTNETKNNKNNNN